MLNYYFSIYIGKLTLSLSRLLPFIGGSALPGLLALKFNPTLINQIINKNRLKTIIITGTNGKTTTSRLLGHIFNTAKIPYLHNRTGSNLLRGIASTLINQISYQGKIESQFAIFELDEAVAPAAIKALKPQIVLFTNLFRDQLDRYGEIDSVLHNWKTSLKRLPKNSTLIFNSDDPSLSYLASTTSNQQISFGLPKSKQAKNTLSHSADAIFCPLCLKPLKFTTIFTSHLGHYTCSDCSFKRQNPTISLPKNLTTKLPGLHNLYNILAATSIAKTIKIDQKIIDQAISDFTPAFGRAESFNLNQRSTSILLVKNPTGFNVTLETLKAKEHLNQSLLLILNDLIADGTDVSWIWDVDFEVLKDRTKPIIVSGIRAYDLALRLKLAGLKSSKIKIVKNLSKALKALQAQSGHQAYILPTYTAMLRLRKILTQQKIIHSTWKD